jgi:hypothetical protein
MIIPVKTFTFIVDANLWRTINTEYLRASAYTHTYARTHAHAHKHAHARTELGGLIEK